MTQLRKKGRKYPGAGCKTAWSLSQLLAKTESYSWLLAFYLTEKLDENKNEKYVKSKSTLKQLSLPIAEGVPLNDLLLQLRGVS